MNKKLCVIGLGYIGLPNAVVFAQNDFSVIGVDVNETVVERLNKGIVQTEEVGLDVLARELVSENKLRATTTPVVADIFIIAVPTPQNDDRTANLQFVEQAVHSLLPVLEEGNIVIIESTIPPKTTRHLVAKMIQDAGFKPGENVFIAHCPERVLPGRILTELYGNSRTVGGINPTSARKAADVYRTFVQGNIVETSAESAEMSKLMENTYRSVNIALANELTKISEGLNIDPLEVISLANEHPRVNIHQPGPGVGGHCIAVDPYFIIEQAPTDAQLIRQAMEVNESMPAFVVEQVKKAVHETNKIALFGLAYKGNVDDVRDSPAVKIAGKLIAQHYDIKIYDPFVRESDVPFHLSSFEDTLRDADLLLILTDHDEFKQLDWCAVKRLMRTAKVFDTKDCVQNNPEEVDFYNYRNLFELKYDRVLAKVTK